MSKRRKSRATRRNGLPKGSYRLPNGGIAMPIHWSAPDARGRRIGVRAIRREQPDLKLLAKAFIEVAKAEIEAEADDHARS